MKKYIPIEKPTEPAPTIATPISVEAVVTVKVYPLIMDKLDGAIAYGVHHAYKHCENPSREDIIHSVELSVSNAMCELFNFHDGFDEAAV